MLIVRLLALEIVITVLFLIQEMYNNIVIYIVGHGAEDAGLSPNEMHIFQCVNVSARDVVEDLKSFKQGRYRQETPYLLQ